MELGRVVKDVLMRLCGVQKGCVKIAELFVSILFAPVAQRIERRFPKPCVGGSSPLGGASVFRSTFGGPFLLGLSLLPGLFKSVSWAYLTYGRFPLSLCGAASVSPPSIASAQ